MVPRGWDKPPLLLFLFQSYHCLVLEVNVVSGAMQQHGVNKPELSGWRIQNWSPGKWESTEGDKREGGAQEDNSRKTSMILGSSLGCKCVNLALNTVPQTLGTELQRRPSPQTLSCNLEGLHTRQIGIALQRLRKHNWKHTMATILRRWVRNCGLKIESTAF